MFRSKRSKKLGFRITREVPQSSIQTAKRVCKDHITSFYDGLATELWFSFRPTKTPFLEETGAFRSKDKKKLSFPHNPSSSIESLGFCTLRPWWSWGQGMVTKYRRVPLHFLVFSG